MAEKTNTLTGYKKFLIVDGNAIARRTYHALPVLITRNGKLVNVKRDLAKV